MDDALLARSLEQPGDIVKIWAASTELLLHPRYQDIVSSLHRAHVHLAISTNAMPLTETAARFLVDNKLKSLGFSINGATKEVFEGIMQRVSFDRFVKNVGYFVNYNKSQGSPVGIGFTMVAMKRNIHQVPEILRLIHSITGPGYGLHVSSLEAPGTDKQRAFYEGEHPRNVPREQLSAIFREAQRVAAELRMGITCFYYKGVGDVIRDLDNIPQVTW
jgi:sulfatase maturation enzyme AslB (radical SAM superfamily)